jgi:hypothetical protein
LIPDIKFDKPSTSPPPPPPPHQSSDPADPRLDKQVVHRNKTFEEIMCTETQYVRQLGAVVSVRSSNLIYIILIIQTNPLFLLHHGYQHHQDNHHQDQHLHHQPGFEVILLPSEGDHKDALSTTLNNEVNWEDEDYNHPK